MPNFRILYDNALDTALTLTTTTSASASLGAANLQTDTKSQVWRATAKSGTITATWTNAVLVGGVILPFTNLSPTATVQIKCYTNVGDGTAVHDSGAILACPAIPLALMSWGTVPLGANSYSYGGGTTARVWLSTTVSCKKVEVIITDTNNTAAYIEVSRLALGAYWEGAKNADYGASVTPVDTGKHFRNDAGDLQTDIGTRHRKVSFALSKLSPSERNTLWRILWGNGMTKPLFFSLFPNDTDTSLEQTHQCWCKLEVTPAMSIPSYLLYASSLELLEV